MNDINRKNCITGDVSFYLEVILENCKKTRLKSIASSYGLKLSDKLTKLQMVQAVLPAIVSGLNIKLKQYNDDELMSVLNCMQTESMSESIVEDIMNLRPYKDGLIYFYINNNDFIPVIPLDIAGKIQAFHANHIEIASYDEMTRCAMASALIYGSFTPEMLSNVFISYTSKDCSCESAAEYLSTANSDLFDFNEGKASCRLAEFHGLSDIAETLNCYIPKKKEIDAYAIHGFDTTNYYYRQIVGFVYAKIGVSYRHAAQLIKDIELWCMTDGELPAIFKSIQLADPRISADQFNFLLDMIGMLSYQTCKWNLKGNKPCNVSGLKQKQMPKVRESTVNTVKAESVRIAPKVRRNDPCPCGSGKKYKKCCGKK